MKKLLKTQIGRFIAGVVALVLVIAVTAGANYLHFLKADVTGQQVMSMSDESKEIAASLTEDVSIYYISTDSAKELWVEELAMKYAAASSHITYEMVPPTGSKANQLAVNTGEALTENTVVVESGDRSVAIAAEEMYNIVYNQMYLYYYGEYYAEEEYFIADQQLANAILYVTRDDLPVIYALTGHGETTAAGMMLDQIKNSNIVLKSLTLTDAVPEDAAAVLIYAPTTDLTDAETTALLSYLKEGGDLILMTNYMMESMPNLETVTAYYGMEPVYGVVLDVTGGYCYSADYPQYITPDLAAHDVTRVLAEAGVKPVMPLSGAMERNNIRRTGLDVTSLMTTSATAYMKNNPMATTIEQEETDPTGAFTVAMAASEGDTRVTWYASASFLSDNDVSVSSGYNLFVLDGTLKWMMPVEAQMTIETENLMATSLSVPAEQTNMIIIAVFVPALVMLIVAVIAKKKKK